MNGPGAGAVQQVPQQQVVVQQEEQPKKESKYGGLKQTVRTVPFLSCCVFWVLGFFSSVFWVLFLCFVSIIGEERCADVFLCLLLGV